MKKVILSFVLFGAIGFTSCNSDDSPNLLQQQLANNVACELAFESNSQAQTAYLQNVTTETCDTYKTTLTALINSTFCGLDADDIASYQTELDTVATNCAD